VIPFTREFHEAAVRYRVLRQLRILSELQRDRSAVLLDLGIGDGPGLATRLSMGLTVIGLDINAQRLKQLKREFPRVHVVVADAKSLPFRDASFDFAVASQLLEHLNRPERAVSEAYRILRPGGYFLVDVPWLYEIYRGMSAFLLRQLQVMQRSGEPTLFFRILWRFRGGDVRRRLHTQFLCWLLGALRPFAWMRNGRTDEEFIAAYIQGLVREGNLHLHFYGPGEWVRIIESAGFLTFKRTGTWITPPLIDRVGVFNKLFGRLERYFSDHFLSYIGQMLIIATQKPRASMDANHRNRPDSPAFNVGT
jgi:SAM-dependent methyltransferase